MSKYQKIMEKIKLLQQLIEKIKKIDKKLVFNLVKQFRTTLNLATILKTIKVKRGTYYYWLKVKSKQQAKTEQYNLQQKRIKTLCQRYQYFYGHRKITILYQRAFGEYISKKRVYRIMKTNNISCRLRIKRNFTYRNLKNNVQIIPNLINQDFNATRPFQKLFTDITYFKTNQGFLFFSCVIDSYNNQIVAFHTSDHQNKDLVLNTIKQLPKLKDPCVIHSDQGTVYQSLKIQNTLAKKGFLMSMSRKANPRDNAVVENFFGQMKSILEHQHQFLFNQPPTKIKKIINQFPEFWNQKWFLTKLNLSSPLQYAQAA